MMEPLPGEQFTRVTIVPFRYRLVKANYKLELSPLEVFYRFTLGHYIPADWGVDVKYKLVSISPPDASFLYLKHKDYLMDVFGAEDGSMRAADSWVSSGPSVRKEVPVGSVFLGHGYLAIALDVNSP